MTTAAVPKKPPRILVAEDDPEMLALVTEHLEEQGYTVVGASRGAEAVAQLQGGEFDLLLTDLRMPDVDGMEVLRVAKDRRPELPVVLITAFGTIETAIQAIRQGAYDYVTKPFALEEISLLGRKAQGGEVRVVPLKHHAPGLLVHPF